MKRDKHGFVMLEVILVIMAGMILAASLYLLAGMEQRRVQAHVKEDEAYYAALAAVRMMAQEMMTGNDDEGTVYHALSSGNGMKKQTTRLLFESDELEEPVQIPVTIWSKRNGDELVLAAEAESGGKTSIMTVRMEYQNTEMCDDESEGCDPDSLLSEEEAGKRWMIRSYESDRYQ